VWLLLEVRQEIILDISEPDKFNWNFKPPQSDKAIKEKDSDEEDEAE